MLGALTILKILGTEIAAVQYRSNINRGVYRLQEIHDRLLAYYGDPRWWPARTPFEVMVGAVLTQNTSWHSVEKSIAALGEAAFLPSAFDALDPDELTVRIRPSGFAARKAQYLMTLVAWYHTYGASPQAVSLLPLERVRRELLSLRGVGKETADSILLYAFGFPTFVIDAYTLRLLSRLPLGNGGGYDEAKSLFERHLPPDVALYNRYHALIVRHAQRHCRKSKPLCSGCPLESLCRVGTPSG